MEGGDTWYYDPSTPVHPMFKINATADGSGDLSSLTGQAGTFTEGMSFVYNGENAWIDRIEPIAPAVKIFQNQSPAYGTAVAYDGGTYKTIGASHEFGGLSDGASTKAALMEKYLNFFGVLSAGVTASFQADQTEICVNGQVQFTDNSVGEVLEWQWEFQGGTPTSSTEQNPTVTYYFPGNYNVSLTVTGPNGSNTMTKNNYIHVLTTPGASATPSGTTALCQNAANTTYTTTGATYATQYIWSIVPAEAGTISGNGLTALVNWADNYNGTAQISVYGTNICGQGMTSQALSIEIMPLPLAAGEISGNHEVCQGFTDIFMVEAIGQCNSYNWMLTPAQAGTLQVNDNEVTITWSDTFAGNAVLKVCGVNACGEGPVSSNFDILVENCTGINNFSTENAIAVFPNPNAGKFLLELDLHDQVVVSLVNALGEVVYTSGSIKVNGKTSQSIEINLTEGVYFLKVEGVHTQYVEKVLITK
jgi:PKD repeat protein